MWGMARRMGWTGEGEGNRLSGSEEGWKKREVIYVWSVEVRERREGITKDESIKGDQPHNHGTGMKKKTATLTTHAGIIYYAWSARPASSDFAIREMREHRVTAWRRLHIKGDGSTSEETERNVGHKCGTPTCL